MTMAATRQVRQAAAVAPIPVNVLDLTDEEVRCGVVRAEAIRWGDTTFVKIKLGDGFESSGTFVATHQTSDEVRIAMARNYALRRLERQRTRYWK